MSRVGIWCVEQKAARSVRGWNGANEGRLAKKTFATEEEAQAEVVRLRVMHGFWAGGNWVFFTVHFTKTSSATP